MAERPPPGYNRRDKPLPHDFTYLFDLKIADDTKNKAMCTFLRTSKLSVDPKTIPVNTRHASYAVDTGPLICFDSIVQMITITQDIQLTEESRKTDNIGAISIYDWNIHGAFEDSWTPADEKTTTTIAQLLHVISDTTNEDVVPEVAGNTDLPALDQPLSSVTGTEIFATYNMAVSAVQENTSADAGTIDELFDAKQYYTNGGKLNSLMGRMNKTILNQETKIHSSRFERKFTPRNVRFGNPHMFFARQFLLPKLLDSAQLTPFSQAVTATKHVGVRVNVRFNEWNPDFDQARM